MILNYSFNIKIFENREEMGKKAAKDAGDALRYFLSIQKEVNCIFAAAPSQNEFLKYLSLEVLDWGRINAFHMDEYIGLAKDDKRCFVSYLKDHIFSKVPFKGVYCLDTSTEDIEMEMERYANLLKKYPVDITFMGIGENGHIAFNDPHIADFNDKKTIKIVDLDEKCRMQQVHDKCFDKIEEVPKYAVTLTIPALMKAKKVFCMVPGKTKREAVRKTVFGEITKMCPATIMRLHNDSSLYLDKDSAEYLALE